MLGIDGTVKKNRMAVIRSSSAVVVSSQNAEPRMGLFAAADLLAPKVTAARRSIRISRTPPAAWARRRIAPTAICPSSNDNNAWMAQLLGFGTGTVNFFGRYAYVGEGHEGFHAVVWTEPEEPQAAIGSHLQNSPTRPITKNISTTAASCRKPTSTLGRTFRTSVLRGEYLYTANGPGGFEVFDVANIDQKGFSERMVTAPVSPLGQRTRIHTTYATSHRAAEHARARPAARAHSRKTKNNRSTCSTRSFMSPTAKKASLTSMSRRLSTEIPITIS